MSYELWSVRIFMFIPSGKSCTSLIDRTEPSVNHGLVLE